TFEEYWAARGKNLRHNVRKQRNRLEKVGATTRLEVLRLPEEVAAAIADFGNLESAGWKATGGTAVHPGNAQGRFYRAMLEEFCRLGCARIYRYRFDERVVAMDLCIEAGGTLIVLKTAHDDAITGMSPAFLMREEAFRHIFEERRIQRIEFYGRLMDWHTKWSHEVRTMYHVNCYRWPVVGRLKETLARARALGRRAPAAAAEQS
ncbi:MAG TPA: GNAT family N-acetyltransferase, partial [Burkholderiales bacterium]|nr:GNAT family N-acetyltransferase [Burkholderiales bacterium]